MRLFRLFRAVNSGKFNDREKCINDTNAFALSHIWTEPNSEIDIIRAPITLCANSQTPFLTIPTFHRVYKLEALELNSSWLDAYLVYIFKQNNPKTKLVED